MQEILKLKPIFQERIWGGTRLRDYFGYALNSTHTGECWAISAHDNGDCLIDNGPLIGQPLSRVYREHRELFGFSQSAVFPLLTKILDASEDLSVQVHPDDEYAARVENDLGKTECWYIIHCEEDAEIIFGHSAKTRDELSQMIHGGEWDNLLKRMPIKAGDFFYVPSGTIHALCRGTLVLETQQSSDTTYRVYDYDRRDTDGNLRELHVDSAIKVSNVPHEGNIILPEIREAENMKITSFVENNFFTVEKWEVFGETVKSLAHYTLISVLEGEGRINDMEVKKGDHLILTSLLSQAVFSGRLTMISSWIDDSLKKK